MRKIERHERWVRRDCDTNLSRNEIIVRKDTEFEEIEMEAQEKLSVVSSLITNV